MAEALVSAVIRPTRSRRLFSLRGKNLSNMFVLVGIYRYSSLPFDIFRNSFASWISFFPIQQLSDVRPGVCSVNPHFHLQNQSGHSKNKRKNASTKTQIETNHKTNDNRYHIHKSGILYFLK